MNIEIWDLYNEINTSFKEDSIKEDSLTEELEESKTTTLYEDYKFLTDIELEKLNASHLIGTPALKAYMHGYFMELK